MMYRLWMRIFHGGKLINTDEFLGTRLTEKERRGRKGKATFINVTESK
jgi:hypothetical protein